MILNCRRNSLINYYPFNYVFCSSTLGFIVLHYLIIYVQSFAACLQHVVASVATRPANAAWKCYAAAVDHQDNRTMTRTYQFLVLCFEHLTFSHQNKQTPEWTSTLVIMYILCLRNSARVPAVTACICDCFCVWSICLKKVSFCLMFHSVWGYRWLEKPMVALNGCVQTHITK